MSEEEKKPEPAEFPKEVSAESLQLSRSYGVLLGENMTSGSKTTWPELVGVAGEEAEKKIKEEVPGVTVRIIPQGSFVTMDFNTNRVRIFVDPSGKVANAPKIG